MAKPKAEDDREKRIEDLKRHAEELCGGQMKVASLHDCSAEAEEAFWKQLVDYEEAPIVATVILSKHEGAERLRARRKIPRMVALPC